jgi:hypothetical protein
VHPDSGAADPTATQPYATLRNPFVYFHTLVDRGDCQSDDQPAQPGWPGCWGTATVGRSCFSARTRAMLARRVRGRTGQGIAPADSYLKWTVPGILDSALYRHGGALCVLFSAPAAVAGSPARAGALVLSPFTMRNSTDTTAYGPYSVLRTIEVVFGLNPLARAHRAHSFAARAFARARSA